MTRIARIAHADGVSHAIVEPEGYVLLEDAFATRVRHTRVVVPAAAATLLTPVTPRTVVGMAHNSGPADRELPPQAFLKPAGSVIGPGAPIPIPEGIGLVEAEAELAVVIGRTATGLTVANALDHVLGYTVGNDVTARDLQRSDPLWFAAKGFDGCTPIGPMIATGLDPDGLALGLSVDGVDVRGASTADLARSVVECLVYVTSVLTLYPGDVLLTGAPGQTAPIRPGAQVAATVAGIGTLHNTVTARRTAKEVVR